MCQIRSYGIMCTWQHFSLVGATMVSWGMLLLAYASTTKTDVTDLLYCLESQTVNLKSAYLKEFH